MAKNSEVYKTAQERAKAFQNYCEHHMTCCDCEMHQVHERSTIGRSMCAYTWLDLKAEDEKPFPCPFCGSELDVSKAVNTKSYGIHCGCGYYAPWKHTKHDAIATHNRVAKKCMEVKE